MVVGSGGAGDEVVDTEAVAELADDGVEVEVIDEEAPGVNKDDRDDIEALPLT